MVSSWAQGSAAWFELGSTFPFREVVCPSLGCPHLPPHLGKWGALGLHEN